MTKRLVSLILMLSFLLAAFNAGGFEVFASIAGTAEETDAFSRFILTFRHGTNPAELLAEYEYSVISQSENVYLVTTSDISALSSYCEYAEKEVERTLLNADIEQTRWETDFCAVDKARNLVGSAKGVTIAVLDTGVDRTHKELAKADILEGYDAVKGEKGVYGDKDGHGTAVISLIVAADDGVGITGIAPDATIYPVRVSDGKGTVYSSQLIAGIYNAADNGADIINISLGGYSYSVSEQRAVDYAVSKGCIIVAAAGNDGADGTLAGKYFYPASYEGVISVAASEKDGTACRFSQFNDKVDVSAPGRDITVCDIKGNGYKTESGTSFSCAMVSGIAALSASAANKLDSTQFTYLLMSVLGTQPSPYTGYGVINAFDTVKAAQQPIITGIYSGAHLTAPPTITFNKGNATLDGKPFISGDTVTEPGIHIFRLNYGGTVKTVTFTIASEKPVYSVNKNSITYSGGYGYIDGMPYVSGATISDGYHTFTLKNEYNSHSVCVNMGAPAYIIGAEDGAKYKDSITVFGYGDGIFAVNGTAFSGAKVLSDGDYTVTVTDKDGVLISSVSFTVSTSAALIQGFRHESLVYSDLFHGYLVAVGNDTGSMRIYKFSELSSPLRTVNFSGRIKGFDSDDEFLYILLEDSVYSVPRASLTSAEAPDISLADDYVPYGGYSFEDNRLYLDNLPVLTTPYGNILSVKDGAAFTSVGVVDISSGELLYAFAEELLCITSSFALFKESGLVVFSDITDIAAPVDMGITGMPQVFNSYTSSAYLSVTPEQRAFDSASGKIYMLCGGKVYYTDISLASSGVLPFTDIPLYITAGGGQLYAFFENGFCTVDSRTFKYVYHTSLSVPDKACADYYGMAAKYGNDLALFDGDDLVFISDISISDIAVHSDTVFVANSQGIGMFGFDGQYLGSIDSGDTPRVFTDGVYVTSRDTVYLAVNGDVIGKIPHEITAVMNGLVFTAGGVYTPQGEKLSHEVYRGEFGKGKCVSFSEYGITVHGGSHVGENPEIIGADGVFDISTEIYTDKGELFVDGVYFGGGEYNVGGTHRLECVMPFGIIFESEFSVVPALEGISVSGGDREMNIGGSANLLVEYLPYGASAVEADFSVSGDSVTVDQNGLVTAVSEGVSVVTVTAGGFSTNIKITVTKLVIGFSDSNIVFDSMERLCIVPAGTTAKYLSSVITSEAEHRVFGADGADVSPDSFVGTGNVIRFLSDTGNTITSVNVVVLGDADGDGMLTSADMRLLENAIDGDNIGLFSISALDCNGDGVINDIDTELLLSMINEFNTSHSLPYGEHSVTASVPAVLHPVSEFAVILYVDRGKGVDSVCGRLEYDAEVFELLYVTGINYTLVSSVQDGVITFSAYDKDGLASTRAVKTFGTAMFRVKEDAPLEETSFVLKNCGVTAGNQVLSSEDITKTSVVKRRTASDFSMDITNAEYFTFNPTVRNYYVDVPFDAVTVDIVTDYPDGGKLDISDTVIPESDQLTVNIRYTSPAGVSTDYKIHVTRSSEEILSNDPFLATLSASVGDMLPQFVSERLAYKLNIPYDAPNPEFTYSPRDKATSVSVEFPEKYPVGSTDVVFVCVAQDGTEIKYTVTVVRADKPIISEPSDESVPIEAPDSDNTWIITAVSVCGAVAAVLIIFIIYRKGKNNVKKIK